LSRSKTTTVEVYIATIIFIDISLRILKGKSTLYFRNPEASSKWHMLNHRSKLHDVF